jgi:hypothetical protein
MFSTEIDKNVRILRINKINKIVRVWKSPGLARDLSVATLELVAHHRTAGQVAALVADSVGGVGIHGEQQRRRR